jgi:hypothetical protein
MTNDGLCIQENVYSMVEDVDVAAAYKSHPYEDNWDGKNVDQEVGEGSL